MQVQSAVSEGVEGGAGLAGPSEVPEADGRGARQVPQRQRELPHSEAPLRAAAQRLQGQVGAQPAAYLPQQTWIPHCFVLSNQGEFERVRVYLYVPVCACVQRYACLYACECMPM